MRVLWYISKIKKRYVWRTYILFTIKLDENQLKNQAFVEWLLRRIGIMSNIIARNLGYEEPYYIVVYRRKGKGKKGWTYEAKFKILANGFITKWIKATGWWKYAKNPPTPYDEIRKLEEKVKRKLYGEKERLERRKRKMYEDVNLYKTLYGK